MEWIWITYLVGFGILAFIGLLWYGFNKDESRKDERLGARIALSAPVWPLVAPYLIFLGTRALWRIAELSKPVNPVRKETDY